MIASKNLSLARRLGYRVTESFRFTIESAFKLSDRMAARGISNVIRPTVGGFKVVIVA